MLDAHATFQSILDRTDALLEKTASRVAASPAVLPESKTAERLDAINEAVAETDVAARNALVKLAEDFDAKQARRADKVAEIVHIAKVANQLLAG